MHLDNDFTGPTFKAALTTLAGSHTRLSARAPSPEFHPDAACAVILLKCKPQIQLCLLWLCRPSVNTQCCHNVAITARGAIFQQSIWSAAIASLGGQTHKFAGMIIRDYFTGALSEGPRRRSRFLTHLDTFDTEV